MQDEITNSKGGHTGEARKWASPSNASGATALPKPAKEAAAELNAKAEHASSAMPTHADAGKAMATSASGAAQSQATEATQPQATPTLANTDKPAQLTTAAAPAVDQTLGLQIQAVDKLASMSTPMVLQQEAVCTVANSLQAKEEAGKDPGVTKPDQTAAGVDPAGQEVEQVIKDEVMIEATEAADQLPLSYPATLVATLPCTVPAWLAHSQKTTATAVMGTQLVPTQLVQASLATARLPAPSAHTAALTKHLMPSTSTGRMLPHGALQDKPQTRLVSRLSQLGDTAAEGMPDQAMIETAPSKDAVRQSHASTSGQAQAAGPVAARAGLQHAALAELSLKAAEDSSAANCPAALPDEARAAGASPRRQIAERGKRAAECSPGAYGVAKVTHKRARSDSPTAKPEWLQGDDLTGQPTGPSDADVQVGHSSSLLTMYLTKPSHALSHAVFMPTVFNVQAICYTVYMLISLNIIAFSVYMVIHEAVSEQVCLYPQQTYECHEALIA